MLVDIITKIIEIIGQVVLVPFRVVSVFVAKSIEKAVKYILHKTPNMKESKVKVRKIKKSKKKVRVFSKFKSFISGIKLPVIDIRFPKITLMQKIEWRLILGIFIGVLFTIVFVFLPIQISRWFRELPNPSLLVIDASRRSTRILDRNRELLYEIYVDRNFDPVRISQIPDFIINATIAAEDENFYTHPGIDVRAIIRAARETVLGHNLQGGSTITQQLIKNVLLTPERTISRKIKEIALALMVENKYSKDQILEMYLNNTPYGGTAWGVQTAAQKYFGKNVWELDLARASLLAGLPSSPSAYSPISNLELAKARQKYVLDKMVQLKYITPEQSDQAYAEDLNIIDESQYIRAPHFVDYVRGELIKRYGRRMVELGGLEVITTLDLSLHEQVQSIVTDEVLKNGKGLNFSNGAAVVLDPKNSEILAYVGSIDYFQLGWGAYDVLTADRQPGSSIKPVTYSLALSDKYTLASTIKDEAITYPQIGGRPYTPVNYDGQYHGNVTLRQALANSYNIPAVKLAASLGPDNVVSLGHQMGLNNWLIGDDYGLSVTLGGKEVRALDLANVYATLARKGVYKEVTPLISVKDSRGYEIYNKYTEERRAISEEVSYLIWNVLSDNGARTPAFGPNSYLVVPGYNVAVKTGTTDAKKDNWTLGYTPSYVVGVWVGNNDAKPMNYYLASGLTGAAPIWNKIFQTVLKGKSKETYDVPSGVFVKYDDKCKRTEYFVKGSNVPSTLCPEEKKDNKDNKDKKKD